MIIIISFLISFCYYVRFECSSRCSFSLYHSPVHTLSPWTKYWSTLHALHYGNSELLSNFLARRYPWILDACIFVRAAKLFLCKHAGGIKSLLGTWYRTIPVVLDNDQKLLDPRVLPTCSQLLACSGLSD